LFPGTELAGTLIEATVRDVQLVVPAASWPEQGATLQQLLLQPLFGQAVPQGLQLINVMLLYEATDMQQAAAVLDAAVSDSSIRQRVADWSLDLYTVSKLVTIGRCVLLSFKLLMTCG
jgi:hypothetical protein